MKILLELSKFKGAKKKGSRIISVAPLQFQQIQSGDYEASSLLTDLQVKIDTEGKLFEITVDKLKKYHKILIKLKDGSSLEIQASEKEFEQIKSRLFKPTKQKILPF